MKILSATKELNLYITHLKTGLLSSCINMQEFQFLSITSDKKMSQIELNIVTHDVQHPSGTAESLTNTQRGIRIEIINLNN